MSRAPRTRELLSFLAAVSLVLTLAASPSAAAQTGPAAGVQVELNWLMASDAEVTRQLDAARAVGARMIRADAGWSSFEETGKGQYQGWYLARIDALVSKAEARGLRPILIFSGTPCWASTAPESRKQDCAGAWWERGVDEYPPARAADYADALAFLVARYGDRVAAWELWNEPDLSEYFLGSPADYAALVKAAYPAAKAAHPGPRILAGALSGGRPDYVHSLYSAGIRGFFDGLSMHPYAAGMSPLAGGSYINGSFSRGVPAVRDAMLANGDDKPIWLTEFGWSTTNVRNSEGWKNGVDEPTQARYLEQAYAHARTWDYVEAAVWFALKDRGNDPWDPLSNFGLLRHDGSKKASFDAFARVARGQALSSAAGRVAAAGQRRAKRPIKRLKVRIVRRHGRKFARGSGPRGRVVVIHAYRVRRASGRIASRPAYSVRTRVRKSGRFDRRLPRRLLQRGRWRVRAAVVGRNPAFRPAVISYAATPRRSSKSR